MKDLSANPKKWGMLDEIRLVSAISSPLLTHQNLAFALAAFSLRLLKPAHRRWNDSVGLRNQALYQSNIAIIRWSVKLFRVNYTQLLVSLVLIPHHQNGHWGQWQHLFLVLPLWFWLVMVSIIFINIFLIIIFYNSFIIPCMHKQII